MLEMNEEQYDHNLKHWPFNYGIVPTPNARLKQVLYENKILRERVNDADGVLAGRDLIIETKNEEIDRLKEENEKLRAAVAVLSKTLAKREDQLTRFADDAKEYKAKAERNERTYHTAFASKWNNTLKGEK